MTAKGPRIASLAHHTAWPVPHGFVLAVAGAGPAGRSPSSWNTNPHSIRPAYLAATADLKASPNPLRMTKTARPKPARIASWTA